MKQQSDSFNVKNVDPHLNISVPQTFGIQWLAANILSEFNQLYPQRRGAINRCGSRRRLVKPQKSDLAIYYGLEKWQNLQVDRLLAEENLLIFASPELIDKNPIIQPEDLKKTTH